MNIYINCSELGRAAWSGTQFYTFNTICEMAALVPSADLHLHMNAQLPQRGADTCRFIQSNITSHLVRQRVAFHLSIPWKILRTGSGVYYKMTGGFNRNIPIPCPVVGLVYDCARFTHPNHFGVTDPAGERREITRRFRRYAGIITISEAIRNEVAELFKFPHDRIFVAYPGIRESLENGDHQRPPWLPEGPFILMPNPGRGSKNWQTVIPAFGLWAASGAAPDGIRLVLGGDLRDQAGAIEEAILRLPSELRGRVLKPGFLSEGDFRYLYHHALFCAAPSEYEGFGLPVAEAMAHGCPSVLSDIPVYREIAEGAAVFIPLGSAERLAEGFAALAQGNVRERLSAEALRLAARFRWRRTAESTLEALRRCAS
jgi:glycosyltransferase involved in cell wall biosynthesis